jgi:catechol 2,3-dioxygenase-like lactoylglutathione lyase family enzyme
MPTQAPDVIATTGHVGINVTEIDRSVAFYRAILGLDVLNRSDENGKRFAFLGAHGKLVLTLWEQATSPFGVTVAGLHHLSFVVSDIAAVRSAELRVRAAGAKLRYDGIVPHREGASSGGIFFEDPDGTRLEIYAPAGANTAPAPSGTAPTCGFF